MTNCESIRSALGEKLLNGEFVTDKSGVKCIEIINASFIADEPAIFGEVNEYAERELIWYKSTSLNVNDIPPPVPAIWKQVATPDGFINSNYGWCIWSERNGLQYLCAFAELARNRDSRRATMIYTRPEMQSDYNKGGMSDFMCTYAAQVFIRNNKLHYCVYMRSNDAWAGYRNDKYWHVYVHNEMLNDLKKLVGFEDLELGAMYWNAASLHVYERQFYLLDHYNKTGEIHITKDEYRMLYPASQYK